MTVLLQDSPGRESPGFSCGPRELASEAITGPAYRWTGLPVLSRKQAVERKKHHTSHIRHLPPDSLWIGFSFLKNVLSLKLAVFLLPDQTLALSVLGCIHRGEPQTCRLLLLANPERKATRSCWLLAAGLSLEAGHLAAGWRVGFNLGGF